MEVWLKLSKKISTKVAVLAASAIIVLAVLMGWKYYFETKKINDIPDGQVMTTISIQVEAGDTLSEIADRFYTDDCNGVYRYVSNYEDAIQKENNIIGINPKLVAGTTMEIPVVVDENNTYYQRILELENQITDMEQNNKWVRYTVKRGDLLSTLANMASIDDSETYKYVKEIANKNSISTTAILSIGDEIWIINPELGNLKRELVETRELFIESLSKDQIKK